MDAQVRDLETRLSERFVRQDNAISDLMRQVGDNSREQRTATNRLERMFTKFMSKVGGINESASEAENSTGAGASAASGGAGGATAAPKDSGRHGRSRSPPPGVDNDNL